MEKLNNVKSLINRNDELYISRGAKKENALASVGKLCRPETINMRVTTSQYERHFFLLRFKYILAELHGCARRRELNCVANKIWFFIHPSNLNLGSHLSVPLSICLPHHGNVVKTGYPLTSII